MSVIYPWSAVVGQEQLKLALLLCAIDPGIGGVLLRGPRGVAKTTLARALSELVPGNFVELPLGATEERVTGSLDLGGALREGKVDFAPGLLARAHEGLLYVDEVNLLPDALVDLLLDVAASGVNIVERDGVSHRHASRFVLVGTMNPDEGELRPQLTDRFGLCVSAAAELAPKVRAEIIGRRLAFDRDAQAFVAHHADAQRALVQRCVAARERVQTLPLADAAIALVSERCFAAGVEGVRADLAMLRAARAHAAWHGRREILADDIEAVAELALAHRRRERGPGEGGEPGMGPGGMGPGPGGRPADSSDRGTPRPTSGAAEGDRGALRAVPVPALEPSVLPSQLGGLAGRVRGRQRSAHARRRGALPSSSIDWFATLARERGARPLALRYRMRRPTALLIMVLDCSASMLRAGALARAKGVARALARRAAREREAVALIWFSGAQVHARRAIRGRHAVLARVFAELGAGGGTPLRGALHRALAISRQHAYGAANLELVLLTDGRTRTALCELPQLGNTIETVVVDCERTRPRLERTRAIADRLGGSYVHVDELTALNLPRTASDAARS